MKPGGNDTMPRTSIPRNNFSSGIISKQLSGRIDLTAFQNGVKVLDNFLINLTGGISKRTGYELIGKNDIEGESQFLKFVFNQEQVYLLEFKDNGTFRCWLETRENKLTLYKKNGEIKYWNYPYQFQDLKNIKTAQNFDVIYITHNNYAPMTLTRTYTNNTINFTFATVQFETGTGRENPVSIDGNPSCCAFYQQRLFYGGFTNAINKVWGSDTGYYNRFTTNRETRDQILDIDGFNFVLSEMKLKISWMKATTVGLILGSPQGIGVIKTDTGQLTPFNFSCQIINNDGTSTDDPISVGTTLLYIDSTLKRIKALTYSWDVNAYISTNLNILCPELVQDRIKKICYQEDEKDLVYVLTETGKLYYLLYSSSEMLYSWGKIKTYDNLKYIETLEKFDSGTNLFLFDNKNNILRKTEDLIIKEEDEDYDKGGNLEQVHAYFYNYLYSIINKLNYLDYSTKIEYNHNSKLTFEKTEETPQGSIYTITSSEEDFSGDEEELKTYIIQTREEQTHWQFEIKEKISNTKVKVLNINDKEFDDLESENWTFNKNLLDEIDSNIYEDGNKYSIVGDGYHFSNVTIENGKIKLPEGIYIGRFTIGIGYNATVKTMNLGGMVDTYNTMIAKKNILKAYFRLYSSWGGKFGTDYYQLEDINYEQLENSRYGEPFTMMDYDVRLDCADKWEWNKSYYIISDTPYPFNINSITVVQDQN